MRLGATEAPRRNVEEGGLWTRCAQSRGEWPGARRTFFEGREEGGRLEVVGAREREGGTRREEAAEGGGRRVEDGLGGARFVVGGGRDGGGMRLGDEDAGLRGAVDVGCGGGDN